MGARTKRGVCSRSLSGLWLLQLCIHHHSPSRCASPAFVWFHDPMGPLMRLLTQSSIAIPGVDKGQHRVYHHRTGAGVNAISKLRVSRLVHSPNLHLAGISLKELGALHPLYPLAHFLLATIAPHPSWGFPTSSSALPLNAPPPPHLPSAALPRPGYRAPFHP